MPEKLYRSHSLEMSGDSISGSLTIWEDSPVSPFEVGDIFSPVDGDNAPKLNVEKITIRDNVVGEQNGKPLRQWEITVEGSNGVNSDSQTHVKYDFKISADEKTGTMEVVNTGDTPSITISVGDKFSVPGVGEVTCTSVKGSDSYNDANIRTWTVVYEGSNAASGSSGSEGTLPNLEIVYNYELNGTTVRTVSGEFLALRRSTTPISKKTITVYNYTGSAVTTPGNTYQGGTVLSENVSLETIKNNGVVISSYYKHVIEVES